MSLHDEAPEGAIIIDNCDECAIGHTGQSVIYSYRLLVEKKCAEIEAHAREKNIEENPDYCFYTQAIEYVEYNIVSAYVSGGSMFIIMYDFD